MDIQDILVLRGKKDADKHAKLAVSNTNPPTLKQTSYDDFKVLYK